MAEYKYNPKTFDKDLATALAKKDFNQAADMLDAFNEANKNNPNVSQQARDQNALAAGAMRNPDKKEEISKIVDQAKGLPITKALEQIVSNVAKAYSPEPDPNSKGSGDPKGPPKVQEPDPNSKGSGVAKPGPGGSGSGGPKGPPTAQPPQGGMGAGGGNTHPKGGTNTPGGHPPQVRPDMFNTMRDAKANGLPTGQAVDSPNLYKPPGLDPSFVTPKSGVSAPPPQQHNGTNPNNHLPNQPPQQHKGPQTHR